MFNVFKFIIIQTLNMISDISENIDKNLLVKIVVGSELKDELYFRKSKDDDWLRYTLKNKDYDNSNDFYDDLLFEITDVDTRLKYDKNIKQIITFFRDKSLIYLETNGDGTYLFQTSKGRFTSRDKNVVVQKYKQLNVQITQKEISKAQSWEPKTIIHELNLQNSKDLVTDAVCSVHHSFVDENIVQIVRNFRPKKDTVKLFKVNTLKMDHQSAVEVLQILSDFKIHTYINYKMSKRPNNIAYISMIEDDKIPLSFYDYVLVDYRRPELIYHISRLKRDENVSCIILRHFRDKHEHENGGKTQSYYINTIHNAVEIFRTINKLVIVTTNDRETAELFHNAGMLVVEDDQKVIDDMWMEVIDGDFKKMMNGDDSILKIENMQI